MPGSVCWCFKSLPDFPQILVGSSDPPFLLPCASSLGLSIARSLWQPSREDKEGPGLPNSQDDFQKLRREEPRSHPATSDWWVGTDSVRLGGKTPVCGADAPIMAAGPLVLLSAVCLIPLSADFMPLRWASQVERAEVASHFGLAIHSCLCIFILTRSELKTNTEFSCQASSCTFSSAAGAPA